MARISYHISSTIYISKLRKVCNMLISKFYDSIYTIIIIKYIKYHDTKQITYLRRDLSMETMISSS